MERKDFLKSLGGLCAGAGYFACGCGRALAGVGDQDAADETPLAEKFAFAQGYVKRLFDVLDRDLDPAARTRLVESMGSACYESWPSNAARVPQTVSLEEFVAYLKKRTGENIVRREGNVVYYGFAEKPGVPITRCGCPIVERGLAGLSGTFCQCSIGYVRAMFGIYLGKSVQVELLEAIKRGGKTCRFKITLG
jgi:predicted ArsR family transcriptional regulator